MMFSKIATRRRSGPAQKIRRRVLLPFTAALLVLLGLSLWKDRADRRAEIETDIALRLAGVHKVFSEMVRSDGSTLEALLDAQQDRPDLRKAWQDRDRPALLQAARAAWEQMRDRYRVTHFYFIAPDATCFLRVHQPDRADDAIKRFTLDQAMRSGATARGLELGPLGTFTLRVVRPWVIEGKVAGYLELGEEISHIPPRLRDTFQSEIVFGIAKEYLKRPDWEAGRRMLGLPAAWDQLPDAVLTDAIPPPIPPAFAEGFGQHPVRTAGLQAEYNGRVYRGGFLPVVDAAKRDVGKILVLRDVTGEKSTPLASALSQILACAVVGGLLFGFFYWFLGRIQSDLVLAQRSFAEEAEERRRNADALQIHLDFLGSLIETIPCPMFYKDTEGVYQGCNRAFSEQVVGIAPEELVGRTVFDLGGFVTAEQAERFHQQDLNLMQGPGQQVYEAPVSCCDGTTRLFIFNKATYNDGKGRVAGLVGIMLDVTQQRQAEEELRRSEQRYHALFQQMLNGFVLYEALPGADGLPADFRVLEKNPASQMLADLAPAAVGQALLADAAPGAPRAWADALLKAVRDAASGRFEITDTRGRIFEIACFLPEPGRLAVVSNEVTLQRRALHRLDRINDCLLHFGTDPVENINRLTALGGELLGGDCALFNRLEGDQLHAVGRWNAPEDLQTLSPAEGHICYDVIRRGLREPSVLRHLSDTPYFESDQAVRTYGLQTYLGHAVQSREQVTGSLCVVSTRDLTPPADDLRILGILASAIGTEEERLQDRVELQRLATAVDQAAEAIVVTDLDANILYVNPGFTRITGYTLEEALGQNPRLLQSGMHPPAFYAELWQTLLRGEVWKGRFVNKRKDGVLFHEEATLSPLRDADGVITHFVGVKRDVTVHLEMEEQLRQAHKMEAVGQLAGGIAHDFNNLLQVIQGYTQLALLDADPNALLATNLHQIQTAAGRAAKLVSQLLAFSRQESMQPREINLNTLLQELMASLLRVLGEHIELLFYPGADLPSIQADPGQIEQTILNLCVNARDAMPDGGTITLETAAFDLPAEESEKFGWAPPGPYVSLTVSDTGTGIPPEVLPRIFEPFFTTKEVGKGTGLGLASVYGIVKQHGGLIHTYSEAGLGTVFRIYLPTRYPKSAAAESVPPATLPEGAGAPAASPPIRGGSETILFAEDEEAVRDLSVRILEGAGYRVIPARDGQEALDLFKREGERIDLVVLDVIMPRMNGRAVYDRIAHCGKPILFSSGYSAHMLEEHLLPQDRLHLIQKPYQGRELLDRVRRMLDAAPSD